VLATAARPSDDRPRGDRGSAGGMLVFAGCLRCLDPLGAVRAGALRGVLAAMVRAGPVGALSGMVTGALLADRVGFRCRASAWGMTSLQSERHRALLSPRYWLQSTSCVRPRCWVRAAELRQVAVAHARCCWLITMHPIASSRRQNPKDTRSRVAHSQAVRPGSGGLALEADLRLSVGEADRPVHPDGNIQGVGEHN
jgi:hypothetical protein